ncbi:MAG TPA: hypothetical protein VHQ24_08715 [Lachnospiraceae bacterium]|nr:hypothetical protein [Lachnospiraceae bacterium]
MKKSSFKERLNYKFDSIMSKGTIALVSLLFLITVIVVFVAGAISYLMEGHGEGSVGRKIWYSLMHAIDAGTLAGDDGRIGFMILMSIVTICGIFITSMLIGIINTGLESKMAALRKGTSKVLESNHTVIIGFNDNIYSMLSELIIANENVKKPVIVVLGEEEKEIMEDNIKVYLPDTKNTKIICRSGDTSSIASLSKCSLETCSSIIINEKDDFSVIKSIMSVNNLLKSLGASDSKAHMVATIHEEKNVNVAKIAGEGRAEILYFKGALSRIIAHTCRQPGISAVFTELFDFDGDEVYCEEIDGLYGKTFGELILSFEKSSVIGLKKKNEVHLNPPMDIIYEKGDSIILIAEDDHVSLPMKSLPSISMDRIIKGEPNKAEKMDKMLILGYNELLEGMLMELDHYVTDDSTVILVTTSEEAQEELQGLKEKLKNIKLSVYIDNIYDLDRLEIYSKDDYDNIVLLSDTNCEVEESDSKTLMLLLYLRELSQKNGCKYSITSEMLQVRNQELAKTAKVNDFVISSNITGLITTQISQNRSLHSIFIDLLDEDGSEIYMKPASSFITVNQPIDLFTVYHAATLHNEVVIGYKKFSKNEDTFEIIVNPNKNEIVTFTEKDLLITIAEEW